MQSMSFSPGHDAFLMTSLKANNIVIIPPNRHGSPDFTYYNRLLSSRPENMLYSDSDEGQIHLAYQFK